MKRSSLCSARLVRVIFSVLTPLAAAVAVAQPAPLKQARVTQVINDVKILPGQAEAKPAAVNDEVREGTAVRTGTESRSELTFGDLTIARLGANTIFSFDQGARSVELGGGAILLRVPKDSGGGRIKTAAITAAITGTTVMAEYNCEDTRQNRIQSRCPDANFKFIVLEGSMRVCKTGGARECVDLGPGQMLAGSIDQPLGEPIDIDLARLLETSLLIRGFPPIGSEDLIASSVRAQADRTGALTDIGYLSNSTVFANLIDAQDQRTAALGAPTPSPSPTVAPSPSPSSSPVPSPSPSPSPTASASPSPVKTGTPPVITSAVPYTITSGTVIQTDQTNPTITTNGVTDEGRIFAGAFTPSHNGPASTYFFTASRPFDTTSGFDAQFAVPQQHSIATFKFLALRLAGNPTILAPLGQESLALISVGDITSGAPGGVLNFNPIRYLLIATQNGSITLGPEITLGQIEWLYVYARGDTANLTLNNTFGLTSDMYLVAERDILATNSLVISQTRSGQAASPGVANVERSGVRRGVISSDIEPPKLHGVLPNFRISLQAGNAINIGGDLRLATVSGGTAGGGARSNGNLFVRSGGNITIGGDFELTMSVVSESRTNNGGNIDVRSGGSLTAGSVSFFSGFTASNGVTNGANTILEVGGNLTTTFGGIIFSHDTAVTGSSPTTVNGANLTLNVGGDLTTAEGAGFTMDLVNTSGSTVQTGANIFAAIGGNFTTGAVSLSSTNAGEGATGTGSNMTLQVGGNANVSSFTALLDNTEGGQIGTGGNLTFDIGGNLSAGSFFATVNNSPFVDGESVDGTPAGTINNGGNIALTVGGGVTAPAGITLEVINADGGSIGTGGNVTFNSTGPVTLGEEQTLALHVINNAGTIGTGGNVTAMLGNALTGGVNLRVQNNGTGSVITTGGNVRIEVNGNVTADPEGGFNLRVSNNNRGSIGNGGNVTGIVRGNFNGGTINARVQNNSLGQITEGGNVTLSIDGSFTADPDEGGFTLRAANNNGGQLGTGGNVFGTIGGNVTVTVLDMALDNGSNGNLNLGGNLDLTVGGNVVTEIFTMRINNAGGHIGTGGNIFADIAGDVRATTSLDVGIDNSNGGSIDNGGLIDFRVGGSLITLAPPVLATPAGAGPTIDANFRIVLTPSGGDENPSGGVVGPAILVRADDGISIAGSLNTFIDDSGGIGAPGSGNHLVQVSTDGAINVLNRLNVLGTVAAAGAINAGTIASTEVNSGVSINAGFGGIRQFELPATGVRSDRMHFLNAARVTSQNGIDFNGYSAVAGTTAATNAGRLTINATSMTFGGDNGDIFGQVTLNGGNSSTAFGAGDGGELIVNAANGIVVATDIEATSGLGESNLGPSGRGGSVTLASTQNIVSIDGSRIEVSSADPAPVGTPNPTPPRRRSAQGGNITLRSGRVGTPPGPAGGPRTVAVNISNSSQLLALLDAAAPGPGGKVTILATGANTDVNVNGRVAATKGTVDIRHDADGGRVNFGPTSNSDNRTTLSADVIRSRALGANGQLNVGHTTMSADSLIRLYATGSNGQLNFVANTTLSSGRAIDLAAGTITIQPNVIVTIAGNGGPANVYTNNPNYSGFGGTNQANGTFGGNGANTPQPLNNAPPFEAPLPPPGGGGL